LGPDWCPLLAMIPFAPPPTRRTAQLSFRRVMLDLTAGRDEEMGQD
jgi:hypothetical protein